MMASSQPSACIKIGQHLVGVGKPTFIIAEVAQAHDGSLGAAHAYIDVAAASCATAIKFQTHIASAESTRAEPWRVQFSRQDATRYDYWRRMEFTPEQWAGLARHATDKGLVFLSSPFSAAAVELLERLGMAAWKIASGEANNIPMIERMARTGAPLLLSSGLSGWDDLDKAVEAIRAAHAPFAVFQTTTAYPCPPERLGLNVLHEFRERYGCPVGLSDHSATTHAGLAAIALGANLIEVHIAFSRECFGPDTSSSLIPGELKHLVDGARFIERALTNPVDKAAVATETAELRRTFGKSIVAARDLSAGTVLAFEHLAFKKPGTGIPAARAAGVLNRRV